MEDGLEGRPLRLMHAVSEPETFTLRSYMALTFLTV